MVLPKKYYWKRIMKKKKEKEKEIMMSSKKEKTTMGIPNDLIIEIFLRLSVQSLLRFRWVCKSWFNLIRDPSFVNMQLYNNYNISHDKPNTNPLVMIYTHNDNPQHLKLNSYNIMDIEDDLTLLLCPNSSVSVKGPTLKYSYDSYNILGSCNGLLCMGVSTGVLDRERYFIWNPCTKEYKKVSRHFRTGNVCSYHSYNTYGFGYDRTIDDYKLVKTTVNRYEDPETWVNVYTLGTNRWKRVQSTHQFILCNTHEEGKINGLFISGHLYYTAKKISYRKFYVIVSFDIAKEEYQQIPIPEIRKDEFRPLPVMNLGELKGCLCLLCSSIKFNGPWEVWMMRHNVENNIDVKEEYTWKKLCTINSVPRSWGSYTLITKLLRICKNGEILMEMVLKEEYYGNKKKKKKKKKIAFYDPKSGGEITVLREVDREGSVENYIESLLSLNSGIYLK